MKSTAILWAIMNIVFAIFDSKWDIHLNVAYWLIVLALWTWLNEKYKFQFPLKRKDSAA
jgi:hypothetical protein